MLRAIGMAEISRIFDVTDSLGLSRETLVIPLAREAEGSVSRMSDGRIRIVVPESREFDEWIIGLGVLLASLAPRLGPTGEGG